jgi:hypothetical protein
VGHEKQLADGFDAVGQTDIKQMKNLKTTALGILTILAAATTAGREFLATGTLPDIGLLVASVLAGWGLITAQDAR